MTAKLLPTRYFAGRPGAGAPAALTAGRRGACLSAGLGGRVAGLDRHGEWIDGWTCAKDNSVQAGGTDPGP
jgi:hypothetical protein